MNSVQNPPYQAGMDARFAIAARHSRMVRVLRIAVPAVVHLFRMSVAEERDDWPEKAQRERRWFAAGEAAAAVHEAELARLIRGLSQK